MQYGVGIGSSKKQAKLDAARATLEILLPSVKNHIQGNRRHTMNEHQSNSSLGDEVSFFKIKNIKFIMYFILLFKIFDKLSIKDARIPEFCTQAAESMPYDMLQICVKRYL